MYTRIILQGFYIVLFAVFPLVVGNSGYQALSFMKKAVLFPAVAVLLVLNAGTFKSRYYERSGLYASGSSKRLRYSGICLFFACVLSTVASDANPLSELAGGTLFQLAYLAVTLVLANTESWDSVIIKASTIPLAVNAALMTIQILGFNALSLYPSGMTYYDSGERYVGEYLGTIGNVDVVAIWVFIQLVASSIYFVLFLDTSAKTYAAANILLASYCGMLTGTDCFKLSFYLFLAVLPCVTVRTPTSAVSYLKALMLAAVGAAGAMAFYNAAYLPLMVVVGVVWIEVEKHRDAISKKLCLLPGQWRKFWKAYLLFGGGAALLLVFLLPLDDGSAIGQLHELLHLRAKPEYGSHRLEIWVSTLRNWFVSGDWEGKLFGFGSRSAAMIGVTFERVTNSGRRITAVVGDPHNILLYWLLRYGVFGLTSILALLGLAFANPPVRWRHTHLLCVFTIAAYLWISEFCVGEYFTDIYLWLFCGIALYTNRKK